MLSMLGQNLLRVAVCCARGTVPVLLNFFAFVGERDGNILQTHAVFMYLARPRVC